MATDFVSALASMRVAQWVAEERARKESHAPQMPGVPADRRVITISRQYGAGGHTIASLVASELGPCWEIWDKEIVEEVARKAKVREALVSALDEHSMMREEEIIRYLTNSWGISPDKYYRHLVQVMLALSQQGNKVIIGRGSSFVLRNALKIRLCASETYRIKSITEREGVAEDIAKAQVAKVEAERTRFIKSFFQRNVNDPAEYDMTIQVDRVGIEPAASAIAAAMKTICQEYNKPSTAIPPL